MFIYYNIFVLLTTDFSEFRVEKAGKKFYTIVVKLHFKETVYEPAGFYFN